MLDLNPNSIGSFSTCSPIVSFANRCTDIKRHWPANIIVARKLGSIHGGAVRWHLFRASEHWTPR